MTIETQLPEHANQMAMLIAESLREESPFYPEYLNSKDAARFTGFTPKALERRRQRGEEPRYSKVGKSIRYALADLRAWMEAGIGWCDRLHRGRGEGKIVRNARSLRWHGLQIIHTPGERRLENLHTYRLAAGIERFFEGAAQMLLDLKRGFELFGQMVDGFRLDDL